MQIIGDLNQLKIWRRGLNRGPVGFVPTMGALHAGHLSLVERSQREAAVTAASIFVNPLQFGPSEDFQAYPRPLDADIKLLERAGVDLLFAPESPAFYGADFSTYVTEERISEGLCGAIRPDHFRGVTTVVCKLLNLVQPQRLYLGQKDLQQCRAIERMVRDLNFDLEVVICPTVREADGLAMSSRNRYLQPSQREAAPALYQALQAMLRAYQNGERDASRLVDQGRELLQRSGDWSLQYLEIRRLADLAPLSRLPDTAGQSVALAAALLGTTRLIDNMVV